MFTTYLHLTDTGQAIVAYENGMDSVVTFVGTYPNAVRHLAATRPTYVDCATDENEEGCPILARSTMTRLRAMLPDHVVENGSDLYSNEVWIDV